MNARRTVRASVVPDVTRDASHAVIVSVRVCVLRNARLPFATVVVVVIIFADVVPPDAVDGQSFPLDPLR